MTIHRHKPKSILICDDEPDQADMTSVVLSQAGFRTVPTYSYDEAIAALQTEYPFAIISDWIIGGMQRDPTTEEMREGIFDKVWQYQTAKDLFAYANKKLITKPRLILLSGFSKNPHKELGLSRDIITLRKPVHPKTLISTISTVRP